MEYLIGVLAALGLGFLYQRNKRQTAEARNENLETKEKVFDITKVIGGLLANLQVEEAKRTELEKEIENEKKSNEKDLNKLADSIDSNTKSEPDKK